MNDDLPYWLALNEYSKFGPRAMAKLMARFDTMEAAFKADVKQLMLAGISEKIAQGFVHLREELHPMKIWRQMKQNQYSALTIASEAYPDLLRQIYDPPAVLYVWGNLPTAERRHLAMVGSRKATNYGLRIARNLAAEAAAAGVVIVSGLAYGVDEAAHSATMQANGKTIAVLASGLKQLNSRQRYLAQKIVDSGGAVISEFPTHQPAMKHHFPIRNRVISGLSHGTLIVEAAMKSGSLITARSALDQNRDVFAIPGSIESETSAGTNELLKMGAHVVTRVEDILDLLEVEPIKLENKAQSADSEEEAQILDILSKSPIHIDEIIRQTQLTGAVVASTLSMMELKGRTQQIGGMYYILV